MSEQNTSGASVHLVDFSENNSTQRTCLNGHVISNYVEEESAQQMWCHRCGQPTIDKCPACNGPLRGGHKFRPVSTNPKPDAYCLHCGRPLPWTEQAMSAAKEYADELTELDQSEKALLKSTLDDIASDTPRTNLAISRFKKLAAKVGPSAGEMLRKLVMDLATDAAKKHLGL